jgi:hypothetical protein
VESREETEEEDEGRAGADAVALPRGVARRKRRLTAITVERKRKLLFVKLMIPSLRKIKRDTSNIGMQAHPHADTVPHCLHFSTVRTLL